MSITKRVAYLKGLTEGLGVSEDTKEGKVLNIIIDILEDIALEIEDLQEDILALDEDISELGEEVDALVEEVDELEDRIDEDDDEDTEFFHDDDPLFFEVQCPSCHNEITIDEDVLGLGAIDCPGCGEKLEFELDDCDCCGEGE